MLLASPLQEYNTMTHKSVIYYCSHYLVKTAVLKVSPLCCIIGGRLKFQPHKLCFLQDSWLQKSKIDNHISLWGTPCTVPYADQSLLLWNTLFCQSLCAAASHCHFITLGPTLRSLLDTLSRAKSSTRLGQRRQEATTSLLQSTAFTALASPR